LRGIRSRALIVAISSDILFPPSEHRIMVENIPDAEYRLIDSPFGHDGFLVESDRLDAIITDFINRPL